MAAVDHQHVAVVLAAQYAFASIGGSIGQSISAAVWTGVFPERLMRYLPEEAMADYASIYGDMTVQSSYPMGSPTRVAISQAYGDAQRYMLTAGACFLALGWFFVLIWKDVSLLLAIPKHIAFHAAVCALDSSTMLTVMQISVKHNKQVKGNVI